MNRTLKKIIAIVLSLMMILSVTSVSFAAEEEEVPHEEHATFFSLASTFFWEIIEFFRYIFYGVWLGEPGPSQIPAAPTEPVVATTVAA